MEKKFDYNFLNKVMYIVFYGLVFFFLYKLGVLAKLASVVNALVPVYIALFFCWLVIPIARKLEKLGVNKTASSLISLIVLIVALVLFFANIIPVFIQQLTDLIKNIPQMYMSTEQFIFNTLQTYFKLDVAKLSSEVLPYVTKSFDIASLAQKYLNNTVNIFFGTLKVFLELIVAIIISFFLIKDFDVFKQKIISFLTSNKTNIENHKMIVEINKVLVSYMKGILLDSLFVSVLTALGCWIIGIDYPVVLGILMGITNIIPYVGPIIGGIPIVMSALSQGLSTATIAVIIVFAIQFIESNFIQPKIMSKSVNIHPVIVITGLIVFGSFFGAIGMILATPTIAVLKIIFKYKFKNEKIKT